MGAEQTAIHAARFALDAAELVARTLQTAGQLALHLTGPVRAILVNLDDGGKDFVLPFNPESLSIRRGGLMTTGSQAGNFAGLQSSGGKNDFLTFDIWLDASDIGNKVAYAASAVSPVTSNLAGTSGSVLDQMKALHALTCKKMDKAAGANDVPRLPVLAFLWQDFRFTGVITNLGFDVRLFDALGAPRRAKVSIEMEGQAFNKVEKDDVLRLASPTADGTDEKFSGLVSETLSTASVKTRGVALRLAMRLI